MEIDGERLPAEARRIVKSYLQDGSPPPPTPGIDAILANRGVFVTITKRGVLRGCIGFVYDSGPAGLQDAAISAATRDPRFEPVEIADLDSLLFEVTLLDKPRLVTVDDPDEYLKVIVPGRDGLLVRYGGKSGLLLPQVATEYNWDSRQFLENTCVKAGLPRNQWQNPDTKIWRFEGRIFRESV